MQTQASPYRSQLVRIAGIAVILSCTAVIAMLLKWVPFSFGNAKESSAPAKLAAISFPAPSAREAPVNPAHGSSDIPTKPTCAELSGIVSTRGTETTDGSDGNVGCSVVSNLAGDMPVSHQSDVDTFLAWHVQARDSIQYAYQSTLWGLSRTEAKNDHPQRRQPQRP
jgi:hypothetical protein